MSEEPQSPFICSVHEFDNDITLPLPEQEEALYQHYRDESHKWRVSKPCQNCTKKVTGEDIEGKVPQPTPDVKNPRSIIVFCDDDCKKEYLTKLGVKA